MWSFATHAGTGLAVAGLSATYYAIARKNAELERESGRIGDDGDRNRLGDKTFSSMTMSQMLLKKELDNISRDSGHSLGLNVVDDLCYPLETVSRKSSGMQIRNIVSKVQTRSPLKDTSQTNPLPSSPMQGRQNSPYLFLKEHMNDSTNPGQKDHDLSLEEKEEGESSKNVPVHPEETPSQHLTKTCKSVIMQHMIQKSLSSSSEERFLMDRTRSPIVYYKNPDFGKRFSGRNEMHLHACTELYVSPGFNIQEEELHDVGNIEQNEDDKYRDSTRFIFPPILSESRLSVYDDDQEIFMEEAESGEQMEFDQQINPLLDQDRIAENGLSRLDEIRDYNLQLRVRQQVRSTDNSSMLLNGAPTPGPFHMQLPYSKGKNNVEELLDIPGECIDHFEDDIDDDLEVMYSYEMRHTQNIDARQELFDSVDGGQTKQETSNSKVICVTKEYEESIYPKICTSSSTSVLGRIPTNSWMMWPVRVYADFATDHPTAVILFLGAVILLTILLGKIFITMGEWFEYVNELDYNPDALMEH